MTEVRRKELSVVDTVRSDPGLQARSLPGTAKLSPGKLRGMTKTSTRIQGDPNTMVRACAEHVFRTLLHPIYDGLKRQTCLPDSAVDRKPRLHSGAHSPSHSTVYDKHIKLSGAMASFSKSPVLVPRASVCVYLFSSLSLPPLDQCPKLCNDSARSSSG